MIQRHLFKISIILILSLFAFAWGYIIYDNYRWYRMTDEEQISIIVREASGFYDTPERKVRISEIIFTENATKAKVTVYGTVCYPIIEFELQKSKIVGILLIGNIEVKDGVDSV